MRKNKALLLQLFGEIIQELNLDITSIDFYEHSKDNMLSRSDLIIKIKWWDNGSLGFKRYFSLREIEVIKMAPKEFKEYIKEIIKGEKGDIHE